MKKSNVVKAVLLAVILVGAFAAPLLAGNNGSAAEGGGFYGTAWALLPPVIAIGLALITKEVYSSLFVGIVMGALLYSGYSFEGTVLHVFQEGIVSVLSDGYNIGILSNGFSDEQSRRLRRIRTLGGPAHQKPGRGSACHGGPWSVDLY